MRKVQSDIMDKHTSAMKKMTALMMGLVICVLSFMGCTIGNGSNSGTITPGSSILTAPKKNITEATTGASQQITVTGVLSYIDKDSKKANFIDTNAGVEYEVPYSGGTVFATKYGTAIAASNLILGEIYDVVCNKRGVATSIKGNPDAFEVSGFNNVEVNESNRRISSGASTYIYSEKALVISGEDKIPIAEVVKQDEVTLRGIGNTVYSVVVDKGHGYIRFTGIDAFIGGYAQIGKDQLYNVTEDMIVTASVGTYNVEIENGKLDATKEVTVEDGQETKLDFSEYVQPAQLQGTVNFSVTPKGAIMSIDGEEVDYSVPVQLSYGSHKLTLVMNHYEEYTETFVVNSSYVTKVIDMVAKSGATTKASTTASSNTSATTKAATRTTAAATTANSNGSYSVKVTSPAGAALYVDSVYAGTVPCTFKKTEGTKTITLTQSGYNTVSYSISIESGAGDLTYAFPSMVKTQEGSN